MSAMSLDPWMRNILRCPRCRGEVTNSPDGTELVCAADGLAYPITDGIPVMLEGQARTL